MKISATLFGAVGVAVLAFGATQIQPAEAPELRQRKVILLTDGVGPQTAPGSSLEGLELVARGIEYAAAVETNLCEVPWNP